LQVISRDVALVRRAAGLIAADLDAATGARWFVTVDDGLAVTARHAGESHTVALAPGLDEDDWDWDDLDGDALPTTLWYDATESVWDVVDAAFACWAASVPACPLPGGGALLLSSGNWTCRAHAHDVAPVGELRSALGR
jgi:hypothetical protein